VTLHIGVPLRIDATGRTAADTEPAYLRALIEEVLFTQPGERVNRPDFGSGLLQMVFAPNSPELAAALQFTLQAALDRWLGDVIEVRQLEVTSQDATLSVEIAYAVRSTGQIRQATFTRGSG
jgi:phage baseplate assembly protein W